MDQQEKLEEQVSLDQLDLQDSEVQLVILETREVLGRQVRQVVMVQQAKMAHKVHKVNLDCKV